MIALLILGAATLLLVVCLVVVFNKLVSLRNRFQNAFAQIEVHLVRRLDLIPNLVATAKGYMQHERETLAEVTRARQGALDALQALAANCSDTQAIQLLNHAEAQLGKAMSSFNVSVEAYPDLKASANMMQLSEELITTENQVSFARQAFNDAATSYNEYKQSFPAVLFASMFGHGKDASMLDFSDRENLNTAPTVQF